MDGLAATPCCFPRRTLDVAPGLASLRQDRGARWQLLQRKRHLPRGKSLGDSSSVDSASVPHAALRPTPCVILPGFLFGADLYDDMAAHLEDMGHEVYVVPLRARDWAGTLLGGDFSFYLERAYQTVLQARASSGPLALVGHSAGGWLARILMGSASYAGRSYGVAAGPDPHVVSLVTLGTPHGTTEQYPFGRVPERRPMEPLTLPADVQGSSVRFASHFYPSAASFPRVRMTCVAGTSFRGQPLALSEALTRFRGGQPYDGWLWHASYRANCGTGECDGDGVCPVSIACVPGAELAQLNGVLHTPQAARAAGKAWYGDREVVEAWARYLPGAAPGPVLA